MNVEPYIKLLNRNCFRNNFNEQSRIQLKLENKMMTNSKDIAGGEEQIHSKVGRIEWL